MESSGKFSKARRVLEAMESSGGHGKFWRAWKVLEGRERNGNLIRPNKKVVRKIKNRPSVWRLNELIHVKGLEDWPIINMMLSIVE